MNDAEVEVAGKAIQQHVGCLDEREATGCTSKYARKNTRIEIVCRNCGKKVIVHSCKALYCSLECRTEFLNKRRKRVGDTMQPRSCAVCGKEFFPFSKRSKFCSAECRRIYFQIVRVAQKTAKNRARIGGDRKCLFCGNIFTPYNGKQRFCCEGCYVNYKLAKNLAKRKEEGAIDSRSRYGNQENLGMTVEDRIRYTSEQRRCPECGNYFIPISIRQYCCCKECSLKYRRKKKKEERDSELPEIVCAVCGKHFKSPRAGRVCCSMKCSRELGLRRWKESRRKKDDGTMPLKEQTRICVICGKPFTPMRHLQKCCSKECSLKNFVVQRDMSREKRGCNGARVGQKTHVLRCEYCGKEFTALLFNKAKYCSTECYCKATMARNANREEPKKTQEDKIREQAWEYIRGLTEQYEKLPPDFYELSKMPDRQRMEIMKDWSEEDKKKFYEYFKRQNRSRVGGYNIKEMRHAQMRRAGLLVESQDTM